MLYKAVNVKGVDTLELDLLISTWQGLGCSMGEAKLSAEVESDSG